MQRKTLFGIFFSILFAASFATAAEKSAPEHHFLYVAAPGIRDELDHGGHGILVFDMDAKYKFVKRIPSAGVDATNHVMNVKGVCASAKTKRLYLSTLQTMMCFDLVSEKLLWEKSYEGGCDRMAISPDGKMIATSSQDGTFRLWDVGTRTLITNLPANGAAGSDRYASSSIWPPAAPRWKPMGMSSPPGR